LKHFFGCKDTGPESVSHISKKIGVLQPSVHRSVDLLIKNKYLLKEIVYTVGEKKLITTDKGAAAAVLLGITNEQLVDYFRKIRHDYPSARDYDQFFQQFNHMINIRGSEKRDVLIRKMMVYLLKNNYFNELGFVKISSDELKKLLTYVAIEYHNAVGKPRTISDIVEQYGLDKKQLIDVLNKQKLRIDSIIHQLQD
jgi:DNA-binding MarR family transcriptional regulator